MLSDEKNENSSVVHIHIQFDNNFTIPCQFLYPKLLSHMILIQALKKHQFLNSCPGICRSERL